MLRVFTVVACLVVAGLAGWAMLMRADATTTAVAASQGVPQFECPSTTHDFGVMDVGESGSHTFMIRNTGTAPLQVKLASTTCKCTLVKIPPEGIPPGESRPVQLEWKTVEPIDGFRHGGTLSTNDPKLPAVNVYVEGRVRARVAARPGSVAIADVLAGYPQQATATIISQVWDKFSVEIVESTLAGLSAETCPADPKILAADEWIRSAQGVQLTFDAKLPLGTHVGKIRYRVHVPDEPKASEPIHDLPVVVDVVTPFMIHGRQVEANSLIWGPIRRGSGRKATVLVVGRKLPNDFAVTGVKVEPPVLNVSYERQDKGESATVRLSLNVELPATAPVVDCMSPNVAVVTLQTNHPLYPQVKFYVEFAVVE